MGHLCLTCQIGVVEEFLHINRLLHTKQFSNPVLAAGMLPPVQCAQSESLRVANTL